MSILSSLGHSIERPVFQIVWAATVKDGFAYPEATLPGRKGKYCTMIGVCIVPYLSSIIYLPDGSVRRQCVGLWVGLRLVPMFV